MNAVRKFAAGTLAVVIACSIIFGSIIAGQIIGTAVFRDILGDGYGSLGFLVGSVLGLVILKLVNDYFGAKLQTLFNKLAG